MIPRAYQKKLAGYAPAYQLLLLTQNSAGTVQNIGKAFAGHSCLLAHLCGLNGGPATMFKMYSHMDYLIGLKQRLY